MGKIKDLLVQLDDEKVIDEVNSSLSGGMTPEDVLQECQDGMVAIGDEFSDGKMFVSDLMMAAAIFESISTIVLPLLKASQDGSSAGKVVIGTVQNDIHNIGKDIVANLLTANGFEVIDMGVDVAPETFIQAVKDNGAKVLAMSCLLVSCYDSILNTINALKDAGMREGVKVIIGGGPVDDHVVKYAGADAFGKDPQETIHFCEEVYAS